MTAGSLTSAGAATLPGAASTAIVSLLAGAPTPAEVVAATPHAAYVRAHGGAVVALTTADAARVPCAVRVTPGAAASPWRGLAVGTAAVVGADAVVLPDLTVRAARWWDPAPVLRRVDEAALACWYAALPLPAATAVGLPAASVDRLAAALESGVGLARAGAGLVGLGPGTTPSGDDVVAGVLATLQILRPAHAGAARAWHRAGSRLARWVLAEATGRTTAVSAALLVCAANGHPCGELADLLRCVPGGDPRAALPALRAVGHTSGAALLLGAALAASTALSRPQASGETT